MINRIINYLNKKFNPNYKLNKTLTRYLEDYFANSGYFNLKYVEFTKTGFSMNLDYKTTPVQQETITPIKPFSEYFSDTYKKYYEAYLNINERVEKMMNNLESRMEKSFTRLKGELNTPWAI
jgi:uncharacterized protein (UPF0332 family)